MLIIALAGIGLGHLLTRRLDRLTRQAEAIASGHDIRPVVIDGADEITALSQAFNHMVRTLDRHARRMKRMAYQDPLTGLANRRAFRQCLERALSSAQHYQIRHTLMYLDLDHFKQVNDRCGHEAGDRLLAELSALLRKTLRLRDTVARLGGDEFGILLDRTSLEEARQVAEKLRRAIANLRFRACGQVFRVGVSIGLTEVTSDIQDIEHLLRLADQACYAAKEKGRNAIVAAHHGDTDTGVQLT
ncbi:signal transduction protein [endosymbiont of unidentified scaly snail isolate Monju]|nr:signal transduction protein [endosymbiont of unidentified scaly snail isolate Monju]